MNEEVVELDDDSDIEVTFESAPVPKPLPPRFAFPPYHPPPVRHVKRQRHSFHPKPCSFCRREFRDKVTVARHTVSQRNLSRKTILKKGLFIFATFLTEVIVLNMLIAIMGNTFDCVKE